METGELSGQEVLVLAASHPQEMAPLSVSKLCKHMSVLIHNQ
jgi:hypothetical protein